MKCRIIRDDMVVSCADPAQMEGQIVIKKVKVNGRMIDRMFWRQGAVLKHPEAYVLVRQGCALPEDEECRQAANMTTEGLAAAKHAYERLTHGIHPDDYAAYDAGYISGYDEQGEWLPGANGGREEYLAAFGLEDEDEDEDDV